MIPYRFLPAAEQELDDTVAHYERERDGLGNDFFDDLTETIEKVRRLPRVGTRVVSLSQALEVRRYILGRFPYKLIGVLHSDALTFIALAISRLCHRCRRRLGYLRSRSKPQASLPKPPIQVTSMARVRFLRIDSTAPAIRPPSN